jgi:hypothetical protein
MREQFVEADLRELKQWPSPSGRICELFLFLIGRR